MKYLLIIVLLCPIVARGQASVPAAAVVHLSTLNPDPSSPMPGNYVEKIGQQFNVSIGILFDPATLPSNISVITMTLTYLQDPVQLDPIWTGQSLNGYKTLRDRIGITVNASGPILENLFLNVEVQNQMHSGDVIGLIPFQAMLTKETSTPFSISDVSYLDDKLDTIPGITTVVDTGVLFIEDVCPSNILRNFLNGSTRVTIAHISPNPVGADAPVLLEYSTLGATVPVNATVYNELGLPVKSISLGEAVAEGSHQAVLDTRDLAAGTYSLRLVAPNTTAAARFVVYR